MLHRYTVERSIQPLAHMRFAPLHAGSYGLDFFRGFYLLDSLQKQASVTHGCLGS